MIWREVMFFFTTTAHCLIHRKKDNSTTTILQPINPVNEINCELDKQNRKIPIHFFTSIKEISIQNKRYFYMYFLRFWVHKAKNVNDLIKILNFLTSKYMCLSTDDLTEFLVNCFIRYPITELELQRFSLWQQTYDLRGDIDNFTTTLFWVCIIQAIQESEKTHYLG